MQLVRVAAAPTSEPYTLCQVADAAARAGARTGWYERYWQIYSTEDFGRQIEAKSRQIRRESFPPYLVTTLPDSLVLTLCKQHSVRTITQAQTCAQSPPDWQEILTHFRGSELQNYFTRILEDDLKAVIKPQYVDHIPRAVR